MTVFKKREEVNADKKESNSCACPMMDYIAKLIAVDMEESGLFEYDEAHTIMLCDLVFRLYEREDYKEAMEAFAAVFMITGMESTSELLSVATSGYTDGHARFFLGKLFEYADLYTIYEMGRELFLSGEVS